MEPTIGNPVYFNELGARHYPGQAEVGERGIVHEISETFRINDNCERSSERRYLVEWENEGTAWYWRDEIDTGTDAVIKDILTKSKFKIVV